MVPSRLGFFYGGHLFLYYFSILKNQHFQDNIDIKQRLSKCIIAKDSPKDTEMICDDVTDKLKLRWNTYFLHSFQFILVVNIIGTYGGKKEEEHPQSSQPMQLFQFGPNWQLTSQYRRQPTIITERKIRFKHEFANRFSIIIRNLQFNIKLINTF